MIKMSFSNGHLIVVTGAQCYIYGTASWAAPVVLDLKEPVSLVVPCQGGKHFGLVSLPP